MCREPSPRHPPVFFRPGRCRDDGICIYLSPGTVNITHNGQHADEDRKCASAEMTSLAVPLIYKDGWPLKKRREASIVIAYNDIGECETFSYVLGCGGRSPPLPDSAFWGRPDTFFPNYTRAVLDLQETSRAPPTIQKCIWAGNPDMHPKRARFLMAAKNLTDIIDVHTVHGHWGLFQSLKKKALPLTDQIRRWACMIDLQGGGFSGRVPLLLSSGRPLVVVRRTKNQDFDNMFYSLDTMPERLQPWVHYAPVSEDFSDLAEAVRWTLQPENAERLARNAKIFASKYLTLDYAVRYTAKEMVRAMKVMELEDERREVRRREEALRAARAAASTTLHPKSREACTPRRSSEEVWNSCNATSLSTTMCARPAPGQPEVHFGPGRCKDSNICIEFTPRTVHIIHDGTSGNADRKCATAEITSLAVPLIYKDGWPLEKRRSAGLSVSMKDIGDCLVTFSYVLGCDGTTPPLPDHTFWGRPDTFFPNYTQAVLDLQEQSRRPPAVRKCLWAGNPDMHPKRAMFVKAAGNLTDLIDLNLVHGHWGVDKRLKKAAMPLTKQVERWACLVDLQGGGFSGRVPLLLSSGRPLLVVRRKRGQDFDQMFYSIGNVPEKPQPWVHYVPVAEDMSDLASSTRWILQPENGERIARNALAYAAKYLTLDYAVRYTAQEMLKALRDTKPRRPR